MPYANPEKAKAYQAAYRAEHKTQRQELLQTWRKANPDKVKAQAKRYYQRSKDKQSEYGRAYYAANREHINAKNLRNIKASPLAHVLRAAKRRALVRKQTIGKVDIELLIRDMTCGICAKPIEGRYHIDHIIPISKGGAHAQDNLQPAHPFCNLSKGAKI